MASLFGQLSGFQFPDVQMNSGPLPSTAGGPAGSDGSVDGVINGTSALLQNISPYALGKSARTGSDRNYQQIPHRFQYIIPKLFLPHFHHGKTKPIHVSHAVDQGDIAFLLYGGERAWFTSKEQFRSKAPPCAFAGIDVVNYILLCIQASPHEDWKAVCKDLIDDADVLLVFERRRKKIAAQDLDNLKIFRAVRMLVQQCFVPHGICAGSEHQGGQHEHDGGQPVQAAVNFVTTMTVDGKNVDLVNYWYRHNMVAGDELVFRLERQDIGSKTFTLSSYYKQPVSETVTPDNKADPRYWQLVPDILRGRAEFKPEAQWYDHRSEGYWRIAQTFQTRAQNSALAFSRGLPLEVTFSPVWHSFSDCLNTYGKSLRCSVEQYRAQTELMAHINQDSMLWLYQNDEVVVIRKVGSGYHITHNPALCKLMVNYQMLTEAQVEMTYPDITQIQFMCFLTGRRSTITQTMDAGTLDLPEMEFFHGLVADIDHIDMTSTIKGRPTGQDLDFYVRMMLKPTETGGFIHEFCKLFPDKYLLRHGIWTKDDANYKMLNSLQITYTNADRESTLNRPAVANRKRARKTAFDAVKAARKKRNVPPIIAAALSTGDTLVPHVEMPLSLGGGPQTGGTLAPPVEMRDSEVCPTAEAFGLPEQVDAGPRKKKGKVLRFLSAGDAGEPSDASLVSTADSGR